MDSFFVRCLENDGSQLRFAFLLAEIQPRPEVPTVVLLNLLTLYEDFAYLRCVENRSYEVRELFSGSRVLGRQKIIG